MAVLVVRTEKLHRRKHRKLEPWKYLSGIITIRMGLRIVETRNLQRQDVSATGSGELCLRHMQVYINESV